MKPHPLTSYRQGRRYLLLTFGLIVLAVAIYFGPQLREQEPDYYNPARTALVNARLRFEASLGHEEALITQLRMAHEELDAAITQLSRAADLDPADRARIEGLRADLQAIERTDRQGETSAARLQESYRDLLTQMDALITDMENRKRDSSQPPE